MAKPQPPIGESCHILTIVIQDIQAIRRWHETLFDMFPIPPGHHGSPLIRLSLAARLSLAQVFWALLCSMLLASSLGRMAKM